MNNGIASNTANTAKTLAQQIAKQMAQEPLEVLKDAREQTTGEAPPQPSNQAGPGSGDQQKQVQNQQELQDKMKSSRLIEALNRELDDIHKQKVFKELQARIASGEEVALEEYTDLSPEQKQVLMAQMEAVKAQRQQAAYEASQSGVPESTSKPSRRFGAGQKQQAQKQQTHVEKPVPPS